MSRTSENHLPDPPRGEGRRIAIIAARFNGDVTSEMVEGCRAGLADFAVDAADLDLYWVPGAWELPQAALKVGSKGRHDAIITLGCVIRGETAHFDYVAGEASDGLGAVARTLDMPVLFGVLTTESHEQAWTRASREQDDKGRELALAALHMIAVYAGLDS